MQNAQKRGACLNQKFWFRKDITTQVSPPEANKCCKSTTNCDTTLCDQFILLTVNEIINGKVRQIVDVKKGMSYVVFFRKVNFQD